MNKHVTALFAAVINNEIVCIETNLKEFHVKFLKIESSARGYQTFYRRFVNADRFDLTFGDKAYSFQKVTP